MNTQVDEYGVNSRLCSATALRERVKSASKPCAGDLHCSLRRISSRAVQTLQRLGKQSSRRKGLAVLGHGHGSELGGL